MKFPGRLNSSRRLAQTAFGLAALSIFGNISLASFQLGSPAVLIGFIAVGAAAVFVAGVSRARFRSEPDAPAGRARENDRLWVKFGAIASVLSLSIGAIAGLAAAASKVLAVVNGTP